VLLCLIAIGATIVIATVASAFVVRSNNAHHTERLTDKRAELDRAYRRIDVLEQMMDEVRANAHNVTVPVKSGENLTRSELPAEVIAELDEIEDVATRAELESDIRIQMEAKPNVDPMVIARSVLGG
jgi:hypothetical protein